MGFLGTIFGRKTWTTRETAETSSETEFGKHKLTRKETTTEKDSDGRTVSKITTTEETEKD
ncbi:MAG: hypothetical protein J4215_03975 [Candidatus Diapherotrites archaeon]|uniref:Uncharacterized protein n=1 Tax=Candidatus Iainarchaeum sp. TaxID=3101447 RepID=A0A8T4L5A4_9ARCH|nr:hypothetical protein [Candidatus Diapherotrites archaeon]